MAHVDCAHEAHRDIRSRACSSALLLPAVASLLIACGGGAESTASSPPGSTGDTNPPAAPTALAAAADGPFAVNLSWQPSTDGDVAGYRVERCQGAGCSTFAQVAAPSGTSHTDVGLASATSYSYRVRAIDAAANLSVPSNVANVITDPEPVPPPGNLPAWVNALATGQWLSIPNTAMSSIAPSPTPSGNTGPQSKVIAWTSFVVDTRTSKVYSLANGGHSDYAGNEVDVLDLEVAQPAWSQILAPTPNAQLTNCQPYYADDRPAARHSYYGVTLNEINDRFMLFGGVDWCVNGGFFTAISSYNIGANSWSASTTHGSLPGGFAGVAAYSVDPATGDVYGFHNFNYGRWNRSTSGNSFTTLNPTGNGPAGNGAMSAMDTARGRILIVGSGSDHHLYTKSSNSFTSITLTGPNAADVSGGSGNAMVYVPAIDRYLVRRDGAGGTVYQIHPSTFDVTTFATTDGASIPSTQNGPYNKFLYVPRLRGCVYVPSYSGNAWFLRVH